MTDKQVELVCSDANATETAECGIMDNKQHGPMNPEIRDLWIAELESGKHNQGRGFLHRIDSSGLEERCCLGVLCKLAVEAGVIGPPIDRPESGCTIFGYGSGDEVTANFGVLPYEVKQWAGITWDNGTYGEDATLSAQNDRGWTFEQIAQVIREEF